MFASWLLIASGMIWIPHDWLNEFYSFNVAAEVSIVSRHGLSISVYHENQFNRHTVALYKPSFHFNSSLKQLYISSKMEHFSCKGGYGMMYIKASKRRASFGYI